MLSMRNLKNIVHFLNIQNESEEPIIKTKGGSQ